MHFVKQNFTVNKNEFGVYNVEWYNAKGTLFPFKLYVLSEAIKFAPTVKIPSFYMVNRFGSVYNGTDYFLIPYLRFVIGDPDELYENRNTKNFDEVAEIPRTDYRNDPLHPYWLGGQYPGANLRYSAQPNGYALRNIAKLWNTYMWGSDNSDKEFSLYHGLQSESAPFPLLGDIGQGIVSDEGSLKNGMWMPSAASYLQATDQRTWIVGEEPNFMMVKNSAPGGSEITSKYSIRLTLPEISDNANAPFILPHLFKNYISYAQAYNPSSDLGYKYTTFSKSCIAILSFGVQPV